MEKLYLAGLHIIGFTHKKLFKIFENKQNYKEVFDNLNYDFLKKNWFLEKQIKIILENYKKLKLDDIEKKLEKRKVRIITVFDEEYPENLKNISNSPFLFYIRWKIDNSPKISIIWSRNISSYWKKVIKELIPWLVKYFQIVSWWAAGCDSVAHIETLNNKWKTISVIGTWIDIDYPIGNEKLFNEIARTGAVVSIFPVWEVGNPYNFPVRNEIVAWLSEWILVIEAREKSWSLITTKMWLDLWKDIFAIPWEIFKWGSVGTNNLIKSWEAKLVWNVNDILEEYNILQSKNKPKKDINFNDEIEKNIYNILITENFSVDELVKKLNIDISVVNFKLSMMEVNWLITKNISWKYEIN